MPNPSSRPAPAAQPAPEPTVIEAPGGEQPTRAPQPPAGPKGERVIGYLSGQVGDQARQLAIAQAMLDEKDELIAALRKELVSATSGAADTTGA